MRQGTARNDGTLGCRQAASEPTTTRKTAATVWLTMVCLALSLLLTGTPTRAFAEEGAAPNEAEEGLAGEEAMANGEPTADVGLAEPPMLADLQALATDAATKAHLAPATGRRTVIDVLSYHGLTPGTAYEVVGSLHIVAEDGSDGGVLADDEGSPVMARETMTPEEAEGTAQLSFELDASKLAGRRVVAFVQVYADDTLVMEHADLDDGQQAVSFVRMTSALSDARTGGRLSEAAADAKLVDTISYEGLLVGQTYTCTVTPRVEGPETGQDGGTDELPKASLTFVPESPDGSVEVSLELDTTSHAGKVLSTDERIELAGDEGATLVASSSDFADTAQSVSVVAISTELTDRADGDHMLSDGQVTLVDTISYQGLVPGDTYTIVGTIHLRAKDGSDAGALTGRDGKDLTASREFTPEKTDGTVALELSLDAGDLGDGVAVAFEVLYEGDVRIASHEDISDDDQAVARQAAGQALAPTGTMAGTTGPAGSGTGELLPQTGRFPLAYALIVGGSATAIAGGMALSIACRKGLELPHSYRRRRHYVA